MRNRQLSLIFFLIAQLYIFVMLISFNNLINTKLLLITSTVLCVIIAGFMHCKTKDYLIMISAISLTLISDIFMIFFDNLNYIGLFILNIIQILYFLRTYIDSDYKKHNIIIRVIFIPTSILTCFFVLRERMDINSILWIIYMVNLFTNILFTIKEIGINNFFPIGLMFLLVHCMLMMFLSLENYTLVNIPFVNTLMKLPFDIKTLFYIPAQVILTCSIFTVNRKCFSKIKKEEDN